jgi:hypothetical protein
MSPDLDATLCAEFSLLYPVRRENMSRFPNLFGFETNDGWFRIIYELSAKLEDLIKRLPAGEQEEYYAAQVKEKFGGLRFYMNTETEEMSRVIREAEARSTVTCEVCGLPGRLRGRGWLKTLCEEHTALLIGSSTT